MQPSSAPRPQRIAQPFRAPHCSRGMSAPPYLVLTHYRELMDTKGIVLVRGDIVNDKAISQAEARGTASPAPWDAATRPHSPPVSVAGPDADGSVPRLLHRP